MRTETLRSRALSLCLGLLFLLAGSASAKYTRVIVVNPTGSPSANGSALLAALASIPSSAGAAEPWKLKLEPGIYDLGTSTLSPRDFVDIEGCGRDVTFVDSSAGNTVQVATGITTELRDLTIRNTASANGIAIFARSDRLLLTRLNLETRTTETGFGLVTFTSSPRVDDLFVRTTSPGGHAYGIVVSGGSPAITQTFSRVEGEAALNVGWYLFSSAADAPVLEQPIALVTDGETSIGMQLLGSGRPRIGNAQVTVSGGSKMRGIELADGVTLSLKGSIVEVDKGEESVALDSTASKATVEDSRLVASLTGGIGARNSGGSTTSVLSSTVSGDVGAQNSTAGDTFRFGNSQLGGTVPQVSGATLTCVFTHKSDFTPRSVLCQ